MRWDPRQLAVTILDRVENEKSFAEPLLNNFLSQGMLPGIQDRRLLTELVYGTLRMRKRIDWFIKSIYRGDLKKMDTAIKNILRVGIYQIMFTDRIPAYATVDEAVKMAKKYYPGRDRLVNAVLRNAIRKLDSVAYPDFDEDQVPHISVVYSHPKWLVKKWITQFGTEETMEFCRSNNERPPFTLRINRLQTERSDVMKTLTDEGISSWPTEYSPDGIVISSPDKPVKEMPLYRNGHILIQDEASQLISILLDPQPGEVVLDACSGAGIKTTHLAGLMRNRGKIVALDIKERKSEESRELSERFGATIIEPKAGDATEDMGPLYRETFDRVLVDAPCSALGTLRRNPEIKWNRSVSDIGIFPRLQKAMLNRCAGYLKKGGLMLYSVCTIDEDENERIVEDFLRGNPDFTCLSPSLPEHWKMISGDGFFKTFPHRHGMDGFFAALVSKKKK